VLFHCHLHFIFLFLCLISLKLYHCDCQVFSFFWCRFHLSFIIIILYLFLIFILFISGDRPKGSKCNLQFQSITWHNFLNLFIFHLFHSCKVVLFSSSIFLFSCVLLNIYISIYLIFDLCLCCFVCGKCTN